MAIYKAENPIQNEHFFVKYFVNGLRQEVKHYLKPLKPQSLCETYWMAKDMKKGVGAMAKRGLINNAVGAKGGGGTKPIPPRPSLARMLRRKKWEVKLKLLLHQVSANIVVANDFLDIDASSTRM